jgi:hypothetical protein
MQFGTALGISTVGVVLAASPDGASRIDGLRAALAVPVVAALAGTVVIATALRPAARAARP